MKPLLILQLRPIDEVAHSEYEAFLQHGGLQVSDTHRVRMEKESLSGINLQNYSGVIMGGGPSNVSDPETEKPDFQRRFEAEMRVLYQQIFALDLPYLGSCYGLGSLINYVEGLMSKENFSEQAGISTIRVNEVGQKDSLLSNLPATFPAFVGHKEACQFVPEGGVLLAGSARCPVQVVRFQENIYATQFHVELDAPGMIVRIRHYQDLGYFAPAAADALIDEIKDVQAKVPHEMLRRFVERCRK